MQLERTPDHVHRLFTAPCSVETDAPTSGLVAVAARTVAVIGLGRRIWLDARRTGLLRRAAIGAVTVAIVAAVAKNARQR